MKVISDRAALLDAINTVSGAVAGRTPRPALQCIKLEAGKTGAVGHLTLSATDAEIALRLTLAQVDVQTVGEALIPADKLRQIVSAEEGEPTLTIEVQQDICHIRGQDAHFKVYGHPVGEFPPIPDFAGLVAGTNGQKSRGVFHHPAGRLGGLVERTLFATARENSRYAINGVLMKRDGKKLEMVATDGRRLAMCRATLAGQADKDASPMAVIIPAKALTNLQKLVRDPEETVHVAVTDTQILFSFGGTDKDPGRGRAVLSSNLVEGAFPPYEDVLPKDQDKKVLFDRDVLNSAVRRAAILTDEDSRGVRMSFKGSSKKLDISSRAQEKGEANISAPVSNYEGEDIEIGFNPAFITDALKVMPDPEVIMELKAPNKPAVIKGGPKTASADFLYIVMPVNLT